MISDRNLIQFALTYLYAKSHNDHNKSACEFLTPTSWPVQNEQHSYELHKLAADLQVEACVLLLLKDLTVYVINSRVFLVFLYHTIVEFRRPF